MKAKVVQWLQACYSFASQIPQKWPLTCPSLLTLYQLLSPPCHSSSEQGTVPTTGALPLLCPLAEGSVPQMDTSFSQFFLYSAKPALMTLLKLQPLLHSSPPSLYHFSSEHCLSTLTGIKSQEGRRHFLLLAPRNVPGPRKAPNKYLLNARMNNKCLLIQYFKSKDEPCEVVTERSHNA